MAEAGVGEGVEVGLGPVRDGLAGPCRNLTAPCTDDAVGRGAHATMSNITKITLMMLALVLAGRYAQAAEPTMLILSCDGKVTTQIKGGEPEIQPVNNTGLVVNFANRTVAFWGWTAKIESIDSRT